MFDHLSAGELTVIFLVTGMSLAVVSWPAARICRRAGFSAWLGILAVVPVANLLLLWFLATVPWPAGMGGESR
jgi:hypothetical protein